MNANRLLRGVPLALALAVAVIVMCSERARASCIFEEPAELTADDVVALRLAPTFVLEAPRLGLWWIPRLIDDFDVPCTDITFRAADGALVDLDLVREGPRVLAFRVPAALDVGDVLRVNAVCTGAPIEATSLRVIEGVPVEREAPTLTLVDRALFDWIEPACNDAGQNSPDTQRFATMLSLRTESDADSLLLDAWTLDVGTERPDERDARAADALSWPSSARTLLLREPGNVDVHVRVTDPATGATSDVVVERVATPQPTAVHCGSAPAASAPIVGWAIVLLGCRFARGPRARRSTRGRSKDS